ncbi:hypothetical protein GCM10025864_38960 [Luteimicrobium album]|uniref:Uncharacterized protein n=1 Tax=Luteimicrobium album TaxID=1054550 RepID=A0ABQ6I6R4_9MICO|nr:hypothetical protein GCM10025864_38960 [Luteimicrobium album]
MRRRGPRVGRDGAPVLAREDPAAERGPGEHALSERAGGGQGLVLDPRCTSEYSSCSVVTGACVRASAPARYDDAQAGWFDRPT